MWKFRNLHLHKRRIYPTLTNFSVLLFLPLPVPKSVHAWPQLENEFPPDFHNYTALSRLMNSFS